jgi:flavodoxin
MKSAVVSYSLTGNNEALACNVAEVLSAEHIKITEIKPRTMGTIVADLLLGRSPRIQQAPDELKKYDSVLLFGPVWMGSAATPLRPYFKQLKNNHKKYAFVSISGGADGPNQKLVNELTKLTGYKPFALIDLHIADLLPAEPRPTRGDTSAYKISKDDIEKLTDTIMNTIKEKADD